MSKRKGGSVDQQKFWLIILLIAIVIVFSEYSSQEERVVEAQTPSRELFGWQYWPTPSEPLVGRDEPYIRTQEEAKKGGYAESIIELYPPEALVAKEDAQKLKEALYDPWFFIDEDTVFNILENTTSKDHREDMIAEYERLTESDLYKDLNRLGLDIGVDVRRARILLKDGKIQELDGEELLYTEKDLLKR